MMPYDSLEQYPVFLDFLILWKRLYFMTPATSWKADLIQPKSVQSLQPGNWNMASGRRLRGHAVYVTLITIGKYEVNY